MHVFCSFDDCVLIMFSFIVRVYNGWPARWVSWHF